MKRIDYRTNSTVDFMPWSIERNCSSECKKFCVTMGTRTKITYCSSCCEGNLCNTDNSSLGTTASITTALAVILLSFWAK